jgi:large subunit ribosomal protein L30e
MMRKFREVPRSVEANLRIIAKTGKLEIGFNNVLWIATHRPKQIKMIIASNNVPEELLSKIYPIASNKKIKIYRSKRSNIELGESIGRPHSVSLLAILDYGSAPVRDEER